MNIRELADKHEGYIIDRRRYFHRYPELSLREVETTAALREELEAMGVEVTAFPDATGLVGVIEGGRPGSTVMLRADIDALPVEEHTGEPWASTNGNMHACGHDCHMAMLLGAAKILMEVREQLPGRVQLLFQAAEESCQGAQYYLDRGVMDGVDAVFGLHIWATLEAPLFSLEGGGRMAGCDNFTVTVHGNASHGSAPHLGNDAIVAAASVVMNLQTFVSRRNDPLNTLVITVGTVQGGRRFNIIADEVVMEGTIRTYSQELRKTLEGELRTLIQGTAQALGCTAELDYRPLLSPVVNDREDLVRIARNAAVQLYGEDCLADMPMLTGSEDFSLLMEKVPGFYGFLGCRNESIGAVYPNHSDHFRVDESALKRGSALHAQFAVDFLCH